MLGKQSERRPPNNQPDIDMNNMNSNVEERRAGVGDDNASAISSTKLQDERQGIILEAFEIIQNEAVLGLEEKKKDLAKYLTSLQEAITTRKEWRVVRI